jgi:hypothetical protein
MFIHYFIDTFFFALRTLFHVIYHWLSVFMATASEPATNDEKEKPLISGRWINYKKSRGEKRNANQ